MTPEEIIELLKKQYPRELRKQLIKTILIDEKDSNEEDTKAMKMINQIFSFVLSQMSWKMADNSTKWDSTPLHVMSEVFPKIETTKWHKQRELQIDKSIDVQGKY